MFARSIQVGVTSARENLVGVPADLLFVGQQYIQRAHRDPFGHDARGGINEGEAMFQVTLCARQAHILDR